jgi:hypothetical protein
MCFNADSLIMPLIEIAPDHFINTDDVAEVIYKPATTLTEKTVDEKDYNFPGKTIETEVPSSLTIRLSTGKHHVLSGAVADEVYTKLKSNH